MQRVPHLRLKKSAASLCSVKACEYLTAQQLCGRGHLLAVGAALHVTVLCWMQGSRRRGHGVISTRCSLLVNIKEHPHVRSSSKCCS